jgi:hypothetical protein
MTPAKFSFGLWAALLLANALPALAQLSPSEPDPLARIRDAAKSNVQACSATGETLCEQVAPKIVANAQGDSPLAENLRHLDQEIHEGRIGSPAEAVVWAMAAFRDAGVVAHAEENTVPLPEQKITFQMLHTVVAEIRGREKPEEWVLLGARLDPQDIDTVNISANTALVIEAARDIQLTGVHPRRSIRFVLLIGPDNTSIGSWAYVRAHRDELDRARAAVFFLGGAHRMTGYMLGGRSDLDAGLREALKPIESWGTSLNVSNPPIAADNFDFLLEGVPTALAGQERMNSPTRIAEALASADIHELKRNTAIAAVTAFDIAERAEPIGLRQSRTEVGALLKTSGLEQEMKDAGLWPLWESGERGRMPSQ